MSSDILSPSTARQPEAVGPSGSELAFGLSEPGLADAPAEREGQRFQAPAEPVLALLQARKIVAPALTTAPMPGTTAPMALALITADAEAGTLPGGLAKGGAVGQGQIELDFMPDDTLFANQWHLLNTGQNGATLGVDINVTTVWDEFTGRGVTVGVWDDGVDYLHADLSANYDTDLHITVNGTLHDPFPSDPDASHGTSVAGLIAAANNGIGTVGVAHGATIAGVDMFYDPDLDYNASLTQLGTFDVTNHSYGATVAFDNNFFDPARADYIAAWKDSVISGRGGLGTINVTSAGNRRLEGRDANDQSKNALIETVVVAAVSHDGLVARYSTPGATVLIGATSNGANGAYMWTTDVTGAAGYNDGVNEPLIADPDYTSWFGGTSAAAPVAAGVVALMLEANPDLGWRDVQTILAATARHTGSAIGDAPTGTELYVWEVNGATTWNGGGMHFSNDYGYGLIDALAAVRLAQSWTLQSTSANWKQEVAATWTGDMVIPDDDIIGVSFDLDVTEDMALEHVELKLTWQTGIGYTGDYLITLTSPDGTTTFLSRPQNGGTSATSSWLFMSNQFRGENSVGTWTVHISDQWVDEQGAIIGADLILSGAAASDDDIWIFTNEYGDLAGGAHGHATALADTDGGYDTLNAAAVSAPLVVDLGLGTGVIDGVAVTLAGFEAVVSGDGDDDLRGDGGDNSLRSARGDDLLSGAGGQDDLSGGQGADTLNGGDGNDTLMGALGDDILSGDAGDDDAQGHLGADRLTGGLGNDQLFGGGGGDVLIGSSGRDTLDGGARADRLFGGFGQDWLTDGQGRDKLWGGQGADVFDIVTDTELDIIHDFENGVDLIRLVGFDLAALVFVDIAPGQVQIQHGGDTLEIRDLAGTLTLADFDVTDFLFA